MALSRDDIRSAAERLDQAEKTRKQIRQLSLEHPGITIEDAYAIQKAWVEMKVAAGRIVMPAEPAAAALKRLPLPLLRPRPIDEVISTAGGVRLEALDEALMMRDLPGTFCAGEMLDWEAPTGGYLLTACYASGMRAGRGVVAFLER